MPSCPQFSLRTLLFVVVMVCLAAATVHQPPADRALATNCQTMLRFALIFLFPTMLTVGVIRGSPRIKTFCGGTLLPLFIPPMTICHQVIFYSRFSMPDLVNEFRDALNNETGRVAIVWLLAPCVGLGCAVVERFLKLGDDYAAISGRQFAARLLFVACMIVVLSAGLLALPNTGERFEVTADLPIIVATCIVPALLLTGIIHSRGSFRTFCAGGILPTAIVVPSLCQWFVEADGTWVVYLRYFVVSMWTLAACTGLAAVLFHWLLQLGTTKNNGRANRAE